MRIFERLDCKQELSPNQKLQIKSKQFAYKEGYNTTMAIIKCQYHWFSWLNTDADVASWDSTTLIHVLSTG